MNFTLDSVSFKWVATYLVCTAPGISISKDLKRSNSNDDSSGSEEVSETK